MRTAEVAAAHGVVAAVEFAALFLVGVAGHGGLRKDEQWSEGLVRAWAGTEWY